MGRWWVATFIAAPIFLLAAHEAYNIRLHAVKEYGRVIHEFDPWFNFRATQYLLDNGWYEFFHWFDYMSWYPLGRPVGTTIYPGMQILSVSIYYTLQWLSKLLSVPDLAMSINDVCVFVPAWLGSIATVLLGLLTAECSGSALAGGAASLVMAIVPAHIMRSVAGGYDNESVAISAMMLTFTLYVRSMRGATGSGVAGWERATAALPPLESIGWGVATGIAYTFMVAAWGGFVFVVNLIALHGLLLVLVGRFGPAAHRAYSLWYVIGTFGATRVPVVGWGPLKSLEQLSATAVFLGYQVLAFAEKRVAARARAAREAGKPEPSFVARWTTRLVVYLVAAALGGAFVAALWPTGYFGPFSARIRGLFVKHTRTGNPLVDSVAEHQPASPEAYFTYLHFASKLAPYGLGVAMLCHRTGGSYLTLSLPTNGALFLGLYAVVAYFFSYKMVRLVLLMAPITSALCGVAVGGVADWCIEQGLDFGPKKKSDADAARADAAAAADDADGDKPPPPPAKGAKAAKHGSGKTSAAADTAGKAALAAKAAADATTLPARAKAMGREVYDHVAVRAVRKLVALGLVGGGLWGYQKFSPEFLQHCKQLAEQMSHPSLMYKAHARHPKTGKQQVVMVDDYREAYWWLRDNTPEDARVMAWWDYGYQIAGMANRTTIADGNTWNHEHIATLGRCLTSNEKDAHRNIRHLADYVLVWAGGGSDDLAKSPHMARIGNSVYDDICPGDPTCARYGFMQSRTPGGSPEPTPMMSASLLYKLHSAGLVPGVTVDNDRFRLAFQSKYGRVRIWQVLKVSQESKDWIADPANRVCDAPGSWYCRGQYPPKLGKLMQRKRDFKQLEDFNVKKDEKSKKYTQDYLDRMEGKVPASDKPAKKKAAAPKEPKKASSSAASSASASAAKGGDEDRSQWADTEVTTALWQLIYEDKADELGAWLAQEPEVATMRAADGRGPLFWAHEYERAPIAAMLVEAGADPEARDKDGRKPSWTS